MKNRAYYGEYTLQHWVQMILKGDIQLPPYQRSFVWGPEKTFKLIETIKSNSFIPPVTIGNFSSPKSSTGKKSKEVFEENNYIIDGQQRLTSIFLAYIGIFPRTEAFEKEKSKTTSKLDENDDSFDDEKDKVLNWTIHELTRLGRNRDDILEKIDQSQYESIDFRVGADLFKNRLLGFSYLVPQDRTQKGQQEYYSRVFRNINKEGKSLEAGEVREALYYLNEELVPFFKPDVIFGDNQWQKPPVQLEKMDFVRYLAICAQFRFDGNHRSIAKKRLKKMEEYYEDFINLMMSDKESSTAKKQSEKNEKPSNNYVNIVKDDHVRDYQESYKILRDALEKILPKIKNESIIDYDMYLIGLVYGVVFESKGIDTNRLDELSEKINEKITDLKKQGNHQGNPQALTYLRERVKRSIEIYSSYLV